MDLLGVCEISGVSRGDAGVLAVLGWNMARLGTLHGLGQEAIEDVLAKCHEADDSFGASLEELATVIKLSDELASAQRKTEAKRGADLWLQAHFDWEQAKRAKVQEGYLKESEMKAIPAVGSASRARWPTRLSKKLSSLGDDAALREAAERKERDRWLSELRTLLEEAGLPVTKRGGDGIRVPLQRIGKGRRHSTLRKHVKTWQKVSLWLKSVYQEPWPSRAEHFAEYLEAMVAEPCSRTFPVSCLKTLMFMEYAGEVREADMASRAACVQNAIEESKLALESAELKPTRKANIMLVAMIEALEEMVCCEEKSNYVRGYAWYRLFKLWTGMRFNDTQGIPARTMELGDFCLRGEIHRSKTMDQVRSSASCRSTWAGTLGSTRRTGLRSVGNCGSS